jgi:hypothetical protein
MPSALAALSTRSRSRRNSSMRARIVAKSYNAEGRLRVDCRPSPIPWRTGKSLLADIHLGRHLGRAPLPITATMGTTKQPSGPQASGNGGRDENVLTSPGPSELRSRAGVLWRCHRRKASGGPGLYKRPYAHHGNISKGERVRGRSRSRVPSCRHHKHCCGSPCWRQRENSGELAPELHLSKPTFIPGCPKLSLKGSGS